MKIQSIVYWVTICMFLTNIGIFALTFYVLIKKWYQASHRYISDLPFILALTYLLLIADRMDSILGLSGIMPITQLSQLINILEFVVIFALNLIIMLTIWIPKRTRIRFALMIALIGLWIVMISIFLTMPETIHLVIFFSSLPMLLLMAITWYFSYFQKRLSIINPLLVGIGTTGVLVATLLKAVFGIIGIPIGYVFTDLHWIALTIDIVSYSIMLLGFSRKMAD